MSATGGDAFVPGGRPADDHQRLDAGADHVLESHLDALGAQLGLPSDGSRRFLAEATEHLYRDTEVRIAAGVEPQRAAEEAVAAFGDPTTVVGALRSPTGRLLSTAWLFFGLGLVAVGLSGLVAALFGAIRGWQFVAGDPVGLTYSAERCAEYLALAPSAVDCRAAALVDHYAEVVDQRVVLGVVGFGVIVAYALWRRRGGAPASRLLLGGAGVACFGLAALWQLASAATASALDQGMVGAWLSGGIVSALLAVALVPVLVSGLRRSLLA